MKKFILGFICLILAFCLGACAPKPEVTLVDALQNIESIMRKNMEEPDRLIAELGAYADANQQAWAEMKRTFNAMSRDDYMRIIDHKQDDIREGMLKIMNLDLEFQDQLKNDPKRMAAYMAAVKKIGVLSLDEDKHD